jgi:hypothetical protein
MIEATLLPDYQVGISLTYKKVICYRTKSKMRTVFYASTPKGRLVYEWINGRLTVRLDGIMLRRRSK